MSCNISHLYLTHISSMCTLYIQVLSSYYIWRRRRRKEMFAIQLQFNTFSPFFFYLFLFFSFEKANKKRQKSFANRRVNLQFALTYIKQTNIFCFFFLRKKNRIFFHFIFISNSLLFSNKKKKKNLDFLFVYKTEIKFHKAPRIHTTENQSQNIKRMQVFCLLQRKKITSIIGNTNDVVLMNFNR